MGAFLAVYSAGLLVSSPFPKTLSGEGVGVVRERLKGAHAENLSSFSSTPWAHFHHAIRSANGVFIMLDNHHGIASRDKFFKGIEQKDIVAGVQADGGLVQHVEDTTEAGAQLSRQPYPLNLSTAQALGGPVQGQIMKSHFRQKMAPFSHLMRNGFGDGVVGGRGSIPEKME